MFKRVGMAALAAMAIAASTFTMTGVAEAQRYHRGGHHHHHGGYGGRWVAPAIVGGLALGAVAAHGYGSRCWRERQVVVDHYGRERVRAVRVCD